MEKVPTNSYRIQLSREFPFAKATALIPYLSKLGIDMVYTSPFLAIQKGDDNPYRIIDPNSVHLELGGEEAFEHFCTVCEEYNIRVMMDVVPNHMGALVTNHFFYDVLKRGKGSRYAKFFDIYWKDQGGKIVLPILSDTSKISKGKDALIVDDKRLPLRRGTKRLSLEKLMPKQHYELIHWKDGARYVNYRRFFDITDLICTKMQKNKVFKALHKQTFFWFRKGFVSAFRIDHPDGLIDPASYLQRFSKEAKGAYVVLEKILNADEVIPCEQISDGSVGYDTLNCLNALFVDPAKEKEMMAIYRKYSCETESAQEVIIEAKLGYLKKYFLSEMRSLSSALAKKCRLSAQDLEEGLILYMAHMPIYRTYLTKKITDIHAVDKKAHHEALVGIKGCAKGVKEFFRSEILKRRYRDIYLRMQQIMPGVYAKGYEDTTLYRYFPQSALNEVGSDVSHFGITTSTFHQRTKKRMRRSPYSMNTTSTHDTKRSLDTRMRIATLSDDPKAFEKFLIHCYRHIPRLSNPNLEYLFYQTLLGIWPESVPNAKEYDQLTFRLKQYMVKAAREGKVASDWIDPNFGFEEELEDFVERVCSRLYEPAFSKKFTTYLEHVSKSGKLKSLSTLVLKIGLPGVMDTYQGEECYFYALVDPDNRRKVDFAKRKELLKKKSLHDIYTDEGRFFLLERGLSVRKEFQEVFLNGSYNPLKAEIGSIAFERKLRRHSFIIKASLIQEGYKEVDAVDVPSGYVDIFTGSSNTPFPFTIAKKI